MPNSYVKDLGIKTNIREIWSRSECGFHLLHLLHVADSDFSSLSMSLFSLHLVKLTKLKQRVDQKFWILVFQMFQIINRYYSNIKTMRPIYIQLVARIGCIMGAR